MSQNLVRLLILVGLVVVLPLQARGQECSSCDWGYGPENGPPVWAELCCPVCAGMSQSPIDIRTSEVGASDVGPLAISYFESHFEFSNTGHGLKASYELTDQENYVEIEEVRYPLFEFHFHSLSEHTIDGRSAPMEAHFVHRRTSYDVVVIAVLIEEGLHKPAFNPLWNSLPRDMTVDARTVVFNPKRLLPNNLDYYTYRGSLTTPDCSEVVTWFVLQQTMNLSIEQLEAYRALFPRNYRPVQPLNGRKVEAGG